MINLKKIKSNIIVKGFYLDNFLNRKLERVGKEYDVRNLNVEPFPDYYDREFQNQILNELKIDTISRKNLAKFAEAFPEIKNPIKFLVDICGGVMTNKSLKLKNFSILSATIKGGKGLVFTIETNKFKNSRKIDIKNKVLLEGLIDVKDVDEPEKGLGYKMFFHCIKTAYENHFQAFKIHAAGDYTTKTAKNVKDQFNGYEFWGKLGFDIDEKFIDKIDDDLWFYEGERSLKDFKKIIKDTPYENCKGILDLYSRKGGYDFWVKNGTDIWMKFDLSHNSKNKSIKVLENYHKNYIKKYGLS